MKQIAAKESRYYKTFGEFLTDIAKRYGSKTAVTSYHRGMERQDKSFEELKEDSFRFSKALLASGFGGKHVALVSENSYEWLTAYFGIACAGGIACCIDIEQADKILKEMLQKSDAEAIICSQNLAGICAGIKKSIDKITKLIVIGGEDTEDSMSYESFAVLGDSPEAEQLFADCAVEPDQTACIVFTSGTTSAAKPVMLSHKAILADAAESLTSLDSRDRIYNSLPLYHTYGFTGGMLCGLIRGLDICICCDMKRMLQDMTLFKPNMLVTVPIIVEVVHNFLWGMLEKADKKQKVQKKMKLEAAIHMPNSMTAADIKAVTKGTFAEELDVILSGGAYLDLRIAEDLLHMGIVVLQGYGITECSSSVSCNRNEDFSLDSVGMILPGCEVKFVDDEILVKSYSIMNGYYNEPELTKEAFADGWFKTGDLGYLDKKGHLHITGRKKNLIVMKNGKKVAAEEMEQEFKGMPLVKEVLVYGALSGESTDDVKIAAEIYPDPELTQGMSSYEILEQLQEFVDNLNKTLPTYKQIQMINIRETEFEKTAAKKIKRR